MTTLIINIIIGLFFVGIGFLVKSVPNLIAGYNTMSDDEKQNVDIAGLSAFMKKGFIIMGGLIIVSALLTKIFRLEMEVDMIVLIFIMLVGFGIVFIKGQDFNPKYDSKKKKKISLYYIIFGGLFFIFIAGTTLYELIPPKIIYDEDKIEFTGSYGFKLNITEIESFELTNQMPAIKIRTNGVGMGRINKGAFELESWGKCRLWLNSYQPPYLIVIMNNGERIIINNEDKSLTEEIYNYIKSLNEEKEIVAPI